MATLMFEGETHNEIVQKVRRWLTSVEGGSDESRLTPAEAINQGAELTKDALRIIAQSAPSPVAQTDLWQALAEAGYRATETTREALLNGLETMEEMTGGSVVRKVDEAGRSAMYGMSEQIARAFLRSLTGGR
jgi:hypothetical protein